MTASLPASLRWPAGKRFVWNNRRELERSVIRWVLKPLAHYGFPLTNAALVPSPVRDLPRFCAIGNDSHPANAVECLMREAIDSLTTDGILRPDDDFAVRDHNGPTVDLVRACRAGFLERYFGLTPDTAGLDRASRFISAREFNRSVRVPNATYVIFDSSHSAIRLGGWGHDLINSGLYDEWIENFGYYDDLASAVCVGSPERSPDLPSIDELIEALNTVLKKGLPLARDSASPDLLAFLPAIAFAESEPERILRMDRYIREQLDVLDINDLVYVAKIFFCTAPGSKGTTMKMRQEKIAAVLPKGDSHYNIRTGIRAKIIETLAWQLYRAKLKESVGGQSER